MSEILPKIRGGLDVIPSPLPDKPGLLLRDPYRYAEEIVWVPLPWVPALACLDGSHTLRDAQALLVRRRAGELVHRTEVERFVGILEVKGFLESKAFQARKNARHEQFRAAVERAPLHAGIAYPADGSGLRDVLGPYFRSRHDGDGGHGRLVGIAAPHVSPHGAWPTYAAAYQAVRGPADGRTVVILGTSHYGEPERFGLSEKPFRTPLGTIGTDRDAVAFLARRAPDSILMEDYCHAIEHSIEFQLIFLQYRLRGPFRILPILCGPFVECIRNGESPESNPKVRRFLEALSELAQERGTDWLWILGIDLAHIGARYGDGYRARAAEGRMIEVAERDRKRLQRACEGDREGLFALIEPGKDDLKWCGFSPLYTFLATVGRLVALSGKLLRYDQWNIDPGSVVSFAALEFRSNGNGSRAE